MANVAAGPPDPVDIDVGLVGDGLEPSVRPESIPEPMEIAKSDHRVFFTATDFPPLSSPEVEIKEEPIESDALEVWSYVNTEEDVIMLSDDEEGIEVIKFTSPVVAPQDSVQVDGATSSTRATESAAGGPNLGNTVLNTRRTKVMLTPEKREYMKEVQRQMAAKLRNQGRLPVRGQAGPDLPAPDSSSTEDIPPTADKKDHSWMSEIDYVEAEDPVERYAEQERLYTTKRNAGKATWIDDIKFMRIRSAEDARLKRLDKDSLSMLENLPCTATKSSLFYNDDSATSKSTARIDAHDRAEDHDEEMIDAGSDFEGGKLTKPKRARKTVHRASSRHDDLSIKQLEACMLVGIEADKRREERKQMRAGKAPGSGKKRTNRSNSKRKPKEPKEHKGHKEPDQVDKKGRPKGRRSDAFPKKPELLKNINSLARRHVYNNSNTDLEHRALPEITATTTSASLKALLASVPTENQRSARIDRRHIVDAVKILGQSQGRCRADGEGGWRLKGMSLSLKHHQVLSAAWMRERELDSEPPFGGLNADEMGFGKTVMMIASMVANKPGPDEPNKTTLIVATPALLMQWYNELIKFTDSGSLGRIIIYTRGPKIFGPESFEVMMGVLKDADIVLTTYPEVQMSYPKYKPPEELVSFGSRMAWWEERHMDRGLLHRIEFYRVVLDEAQSIKNHLSQTSIACRALTAKYRWALTGTPIHNSVEELFPYFKFLQVPFTGSYDMFKANFAIRGSDTGNDRLHSFLKRIMIRRTHDDSLFDAPLVPLPKSFQNTIVVEFNEVERMVYEVVRKRFTKTIETWQRSGVIEKKYGHILTMLMYLRQLTAHILIAQSVIQDLVTLEDIQNLYGTMSAEDAPENPKRNLLRQMIRLVESNGPRKQSTHTSQGLEESAHDTDHAIVDTEQENGGTTDAENTTRPEDLNFKFHKCLRALKSQKNWETLKDRSLCYRCRDRPDDPYITSCLHVYCKECLDSLMIDASMMGEDRAACLECGSKFDGVKPCDGLKEFFIEPPTSPSPAPDEDRTTKTRKRRNSKEETKWFRNGGTILASTKLLALIAQVQTWLEEAPDRKIIIFTQWRHMIDIIDRQCVEREWGSLKYHGRMSHASRDRTIEDFRNDPEKKVLIASLKCGGIGLNLTMASRIVCIDLWWNNAIEQQGKSFCRVFRIGQEYQTYVTRFVVKNTVDEKLQQMQVEKSEIIEDALGDDGRRLKKLPLKDLVRLFGPMNDGDADKEFIFPAEDEDYNYRAPPINW